MTTNQDPSALASQTRIWRLVASPSVDDDREHSLLLHDVSVSLSGALRGVVLPCGSEAEARLWLERTAARVYLGEAALGDSDLVPRLAREFGGGRVGVYVPARRMAVSWSLDTVSNADFRVVVPSICEPCWEILTVDGRGTGTQVAWWVGEMLKRGAVGALVRTDVNDDADLNILAALVEQCGERLWVGPLKQTGPDLEAWVTRAKVSQLVATGAMADNHPYLAAIRGMHTRQPGTAAA